MNHDAEMIQELARRYAEPAFSDQNNARRERCRKNNDLIPQRPPVWIDEIPWHEMDINGELQLHCEDPLAREIEGYLRRALYRWKYIQADMVLYPYFPITKSYQDSGFGLEVHENILKADDRNNIVAHHYEDMLDTEEKVEALHLPAITAEPEKDRAKKEKAEELLGGILPVRILGRCFYHSPWDTVSTLRGVEPVLYDMADRPELIHKTMKKFQDIGLSTLKQMDEQNLLGDEIDTLHCTPAYTNDLPPVAADGHVRPKNIWFRCMAQMLSTVSPSMWEEFELEYIRPLAELCGLSYYGCCEPLDTRIEMLKSISNLRKIGVSPWADIEKCAEQIGSDYVYARKPNPAMVADTLDEEAIRKDIRDTIRTCRKNGCVYEFVLKDISTVNYRPQNLIRWNQIVQETIDEFY